MRYSNITRISILLRLQVDLSIHLTSVSKQRFRFATADHLIIVVSSETSSIKVSCQVL